MNHLLEIAYLLGSISFVIGLKMMGQPDSARKGNWVAAVGMTIAVAGTLFFNAEGFAIIPNLGLIVAAIAVGVVVGTNRIEDVKLSAR